MEKFEEIIAGTTPVLVDFFATWCGPCKMMHPVLEELHTMVGDTARILKIDVDQNEALSAKFNVRSVPTLMIFKDGDLKWREAGVHSAADLKKELEKYM